MNSRATNLTVFCVAKLGTTPSSAMKSYALNAMKWATRQENVVLRALLNALNAIKTGTQKKDV
jgi:hypothetical protein